MKRLGLVPWAALVVVVLNAPASAQETLEERDALAWESGGSYLRGLPGGARVTLTGPDGSRLRLDVDDDGLRTVEHDAAFDGRTLVTPGGYRLSVERLPRGGRSELVVASPHGRSTRFSYVLDTILAYEADGGKWTIANEVMLAYLNDGTRIDFDRPQRVIQIRSGGSSWRMGPDALLPTDLPAPAQNTVNPLTIYQHGDGDDWTQLSNPRFVPATWGADPGVLSLDYLLLALSEPPHNQWMRGALRNIIDPADGTEVGAYLLAGYFVFPPGSSVRVEDGERKPVDVFILPGTLEVPAVRVMAFNGASMIDGP